MKREARVEQIISVFASLGSVADSFNHATPLNSRWVVTDPGGGKKTGDRGKPMKVAFRLITIPKEVRRYPWKKYFVGLRRGKQSEIISILSSVFLTWIKV